MRKLAIAALLLSLVGGFPPLITGKTRYSVLKVNHRKISVGGRFW
jgi:hypothetical protein